MVDVDHKICTIIIMNNDSNVQTSREIGGVSIYEASTITDASTITASKEHTILEEKKTKIKAIYASRSWMDEDQYEIDKVKRVIRSNVFKNLKG